ncbi:RNA-binding protein with multiple splicing 2-like isoform X2 [Anneissia japonica]|uniref:RNA-binding protein with multiple splicing 2-like isoform X2 n=1 Tax=Anneissia japonica TaxID=1529436 RepID=UPI001425A314|nr:RNA-binding protein with multiple splicing 2-like isoform X2 [Anneissia japonica]
MCPFMEVRTLFVSGLPMDAKPRELYLLFRAYQGYEGSLLKVTGKPGKNTSPVGFVTFESKSCAESAKQALQGVRFDPDNPQTIRLEFAKSNTKVTKPKQTSPLPTNPTLTPQMTPRDPYEIPGVLLQTAPEAWNHHHPVPTNWSNIHDANVGLMGRQQHQQLSILTAYADLAAPAAIHQQMFAHHAIHHAQVPVEGNPRVAYVLPHPTHPAIAHPHPHTPLPQPALPVMTAMAAHCSTLFIANLGTSTTEQELRDLMSG